MCYIVLCYIILDASAIIAWSGMKPRPVISSLSSWRSILLLTIMSCDIHTHTPAQKRSTNFILYPFVVERCSTNWLGHGHGYEWHSSYQYCC